jgi:hypothetical protein
MRFDVTRLRANSTLSDADAYKYSREAPTLPPTPHTRSFYRSSKKSSWLVNRPIPVALGLSALGVGVCYGLAVFFDPGPKSEVVQQTLDRMRFELEAYEDFLKSK